MKITIETPGVGEEEEIILRVNQMDDKIMKLIAGLKSDEKNITGYVEDRIVKLTPKEIYYSETVDNKVFAYGKGDVFEIHKKLYELEEEYENTDFFRCSKSIIINVSKIASLRHMLNGRFEAKLKNDECIIISRQYVNSLKEKLGI